MNLERSLVLLIAVATTAIVAPASHAEIDPPLRPETFADDMLRAVGATRIECTSEVARQVQAHEMNAVCARFDGDFERFSLRWNLQLLQAIGEETYLDYPRAQPTTDWEITSDQVYDRIYRVGNTAVGVRFSLGDVLMIW